MRTRTEIQAVELFHLLFLTQLGAGLDKKLYALKGGCNLRFFWKSIRYSEDIDFDVHTIARQTLQKNVRQILESPGFERILRSFGITITKLSEPKQTDTTQRWKVHLRPEASAIDLPTRIEFSRRRFDPGVIFGPADAELLSHYNLRPILASHYDRETALRQKIDALLHRKETQARDIFDLAFLFERGPKGSAIDQDKKEIARACELVTTLSFDQFQAQVVAYLEPEYQKHYGNEASWHSIRENVVRALKGL